MTLVAVVVKSNKLKHAEQHLPCCFGGVIDTQGHKGRGWYIRRISGKSTGIVLRHLQDIVHDRQEAIV